MVTLEQYFGLKPHTEAQAAAAEALLAAVNSLLTFLMWDYPLDPDTGTPISGSRGGSGDGGFRLATATTGKGNSAHKEARALDIYDPKNDLDETLTDDLLKEYGLYREHPRSTPGWCHLTTRAPGSGKRTFWP